MMGRKNADTPENEVIVDESPVNDPQAPEPEQVAADNEAAREEDNPDSPENAVKRSVSGANAGIDNSSRDTKKVKKTKTTAFADEDGSPVEPSTDVNQATGAPVRQDSFGRPGDTPQPRPTMTPDLAEPLHDPAAQKPQTALDVGETTARLHAGMRATGARQYGILNDPETDQDKEQDPALEASGDAERTRALPPGADQSLGLITDPAHAMPLVKTKISELHALVHNIGNVATIPVNAIENLIAEIKYLIGLLRNQASS